MTAVNTTITTVMRTVADALKLDGDGKVQVYMITVKFMIISKVQLVITNQLLNS